MQPTFWQPGSQPGYGMQQPVYPPPQPPNMPMMMPPLLQTLFGDMSSLLPGPMYQNQHQHQHQQQQAPPQPYYFMSNPGPAPAPPLPTSFDTLNPEQQRTFSQYAIEQLDTQLRNTFETTETQFRTQFENLYQKTSDSFNQAESVLESVKNLRGQYHMLNDQLYILAKPGSLTDEDLSSAGYRLDNMETHAAGLRGKIGQISGSSESSGLAQAKGTLEVLRQNALTSQAELEGMISQCQKLTQEALGLQNQLSIPLIEVSGIEREERVKKIKQENDPAIEALWSRNERQAEKLNEIVELLNNKKQQGVNSAADKNPKGSWSEQQRGGVSQLEKGYRRVEPASSEEPPEDFD